MTFYLLAVTAVLTLTAIFGLAHTQTARENLHLQNICTWPVGAREQTTGNNDTNEARSNDEHELVEITVTELDMLKKIDVSRAIEKIQSIEVSVAEINEPQTSTSKIPVPQDHHPIPKPSGIPRSTTKRCNARENLFSTINSSLKNLSNAANSGRINGRQLCNIILEETLRHKKNENAESSGASSIRIDEITENTSAVEKPRMYFGETPLEYVPHRND